MNDRWWIRDGWGLAIALLGFAVFTACLPSCNMPIGQRDKPLRRELEEQQRLRGNFRPPVKAVEAAPPPIAPPPASEPGP